MKDLALQLVRDGEGATKLVEVQRDRGQNGAGCRQGGARPSPTRRS
jgi:N-acetylglutamate synthase/N-acetylornithine aminotransferase